MKKIGINTQNPYDVVIGSGLIREAGSLICPLVKGGKIAVFTDDNVSALYAELLAESFDGRGVKLFTHVFPHGEGTKCAERYIEGLDFLAENKFDRTDAVVALGGGVIGDLSGFIASTYMRGIDYVQVPTSLLAQVDSSVGGKTAIDLAAGKNLVGTFYQPKIVIADVDALKTLPSTELMNGIGELLKYAVLEGGEAFELMQNGFEDNAERLIGFAVDIKRRIVEADEREAGLRRLLNLGHTVAHAIEKLSGYTVAHGSAVATGLAYILEASRKHAGLSEGDYKSVKALLTRYGVSARCDYDLSDIAAAAAVDKKAENGNINLVVIRAIGDCGVVKVAADALEEYLS